MSKIVVALGLWVALGQVPVAAQKLLILQSGFTSGGIRQCHCPSEPRGGLPKRATLIKKLAPDAGEYLLLDNGDIFSPFADRKTDSLALAAYDAMGYRVIAVGDQDAAQGADYFLSMQKINGSPFISANLFREGKLITEPYKIINLKKPKLKIGIVGVVQKGQYPVPGNAAVPALEMKSPPAVLADIASKLRSKVDLLILLSHATTDTNRALAREFTQFDLIMGGSDQTGLNEVDSSGAVPVVSTGAGSKYLTQCVVEKIQGKWHVTELKQEGVTSDLPDDPAVLQIVGTDPAPSPAVTGAPPPPPPQPPQQQAPPLPSAQLPQQPPQPENIISIEAFVARDCPDCQKLKNNLLTEVSAKYSPRIRVIYHEIDSPDEYKLLLDYESKCRDSDNKIPAVVIDNKILGGLVEIEKNLDKTIAKLLKIK